LFVIHFFVSCNIKQKVVIINTLLSASINELVDCATNYNVLRFNIQQEEIDRIMISSQVDVLTFLKKFWLKKSSNRCSNDLDFNNNRISYCERTKSEPAKKPYV